MTERRDELPDGFELRKTGVSSARMMTAIWSDFIGVVAKRMKRMDAESYDITLTLSIEPAEEDD